jgi:hypothetical protein
VRAACCGRPKYSSVSTPTCVHSLCYPSTITRFRQINSSFSHPCFALFCEKNCSALHESHRCFFISRCCGYFSSLVSLFKTRLNLFLNM